MKNKKSSNESKTFERLKWGCRRGMLELDVLLLNFLTDQFACLESEDQAAFQRLIECTDPEIYAWLMGQNSPADLINIVGLIRSHAYAQLKT